MKPDWLTWPQTQALIAAFADQHAQAQMRFVGGAVRDAILGRAVQDVDVATQLMPDEVASVLEDAGIRAIPTGLAHGTITAVIDGKHFEITTLRRDIATDGRHATVAYTYAWEDDAARRDFTMNALYLSTTGELFDYFNGAGDAAAGHVRFIGDPRQRIAEDYLRILRFFRFHAWYGQDEPDEDALAACAAMADSMQQLSGERVQSELLKLMASPQPSPAIALMQAHAILPPLLGFDIRDGHMFQRLEAIETCTQITLPPPVKLAAFLFSIGAHLTKEEALDMLAERLRLSAAATRDLNNIIRHYKTVTPVMNDTARKKALRHLGLEHFRRIVLINWANGADPVDASHPYMKLLRWAEQWQLPEFPLSGGDLIALGFKPGKALGERLKQLEDAWEAEDYQISRQELLEMASQPDA